MIIRDNCRFDMISLGEIMLRLDPGEGRVRTAREFKVCEGGGEYNVARGLHKCFGLDTAVITAFAENEVGYLLQDLVEQGGVNTSLIKMVPTDGIGRCCRNGLNFTERGFGIRSALGCSDRYNTAISKMTPQDFDFDYIFGVLGAKWFHTGGIYAALSAQSCETVLTAVKTAKKYETLVSYDLNYRPSLWESIGGKKKAQEVNKEIVKYVDVLIGNEEDFTSCLGMDVNNSDNYKTLNKSSYEIMLEKVAQEYPNLCVIASTLRKVISATINDWSALCYTNGIIYRSKEYNSLEVLDRVGSGDSFAAGLIYGLLNDMPVQLALEYGAAHGALAMTTPGDTSMARKKEVEDIVNGVGARVKR